MKTREKFVRCYSHKKNGSLLSTKYFNCTVPVYVLLLLLSKKNITHKQHINNGFICISSHALQAWLKENPESDDDERGPSKPSKQRKVSYRGGSTVSQNFFYADDGSMKCTLCSSSGFLNKDQLRQHINTHHTGTCFVLQSFAFE